MMMLVSRPEGVGSRYSYILYIQKIVKPVEKHDNGQTIPLQCHINENTIINFFVKLVTSHSHLHVCRTIITYRICRLVSSSLGLEQRVHINKKRFKIAITMWVTVRIYFY